MMTCEAAIPGIHRVHDGADAEGVPGVAFGTQPAAERAAIDAHCASCPACAALRRELPALRALLQRELPRPLSPRLRLAFDRQLGAEEARARYWGDAARLAQRWSRVAAVVAVAFGLAAAQTLSFGTKPAVRSGGDPVGRAQRVVAAPQAQPAAQPADAYVLGYAGDSLEDMAELALALPFGTEPADPFPSASAFGGKGTDGRD